MRLLAQGALLVLGWFGLSMVATALWALTHRKPAPMVRVDNFYCRTCADELGRVRGPWIGTTEEDVVRHAILRHQPAPVDIVDR
jgi:hypothetical protein